MASIELEIASRKYVVACRDGEEEHLRSVAAIVDGKAHDAAAALGSLSEARQLLFASLLLATSCRRSRGKSAAAARRGRSGRRRRARRHRQRMERLADS